MTPLSITISDLTLDTVVGDHYVYNDEGEGSHEPFTLLDAIVSTAATQLVQHDRRQGGAAESLRSRVQSIRDEEIRTRVAAEIEAALANPINLTNHFGESIAGKTTTLREEIAKMAAEALRVNHNNAMSGRQDWTPAQKVISEEVERAFAAELLKVVADEKAKVVAAVRAKAADLIAQAVKEGVGR